MRWAVLSLLALSACAVFPIYRDTDVPMSSMARFDPERYAGLWYEVASFPVPFQSGCRNTTAAYALEDTGTITVQNMCDTEDGAEDIRGTAEVSGPGRLTVRLQGVPVAADYWVLWVDDGYRTAVVGTPSGRAGWILNREPKIPADRLQAAMQVLEFNGYDLSQIRTTPQEAP